MADLTVTLPAYFGLKGLKAKKERGYFVVVTPDGPVKIHKTSVGTAEIMRQFNLLKKLKHAGFPHTDYIIETPGGAPQLILGRDIFIMSRFIPGREIDFNEPADIKLALECLASFHKKSIGLGENKTQPLPLTEAYAKQSGLLSAAVKQVNKSPRMSDFDILLIKAAPKYAQFAGNAEAALAETNYLQLFTAAVNRGDICHNTLKEENFPIYNGTCHLINFSDVTVDIQLNDLAGFIRRYARRSNREIFASRLLEIYNQINPLPPQAEKIIYALLLYPWPFMKTITGYYSKKRVFTPAAVTSRMDEILAEQDEYNKYINSIFV